MSVRTYKNMSVTLPPEMLEEVERACKAEHRSRSELIREALRVYLVKKKIPIVDADAEELDAIDEGREAIARGEYVTLDDIRHGLADHRS